MWSVNIQRQDASFAPPPLFCKYLKTRCFKQCNSRVSEE